MDVVSKIKEKLSESGGEASIKLLKGDRYFNVLLMKDGVLVDNLNTSPFLEWSVFEKAVEILEFNSGTALKGDAMGAKLGDDNLPLDSVEGYIAAQVYGKRRGESVFRRITPVANILIWAGVCSNKKGYLKLR